MTNLNMIPPSDILILCREANIALEILSEKHPEGCCQAVITLSNTVGNVCNARSTGLQVGLLEPRPGGMTAFSPLGTDGAKLANEMGDGPSALRKREIERLKAQLAELEGK